MDQTAQHLAQLNGNLRQTALDFINDLRRAGYPAVITSSVRTPQEQARLVASGRSQTLNSKHLLGMAFDVDMYGTGRNQVPASVWNAIGPFAESLGLKWGGRWKSFVDVGHFEV